MGCARSGSATTERGGERKWMQRGRRPRGEGRPGRRVYVARRIVAALVVLLLLALLVPRACQALTGSDEEPGSEAPQVTEVGGAGGGEEDTPSEEGSASDTEEELVVS